MQIDLNADLGEGAGTDAELMPLLTSANICCGYHAGDAQTTANTIRLALAQDVKIGAHPGYADREHFGRRELSTTREQAYLLCQQQLSTFVSLAQPAQVNYLKLHGALYNQAMRDPDIAAGVLDALEPYAIPIIGLPDSELERQSQQRKRLYVREGFADRRYRPDGSLVPRSEPNAVIHDPLEAVQQALWLIREKQVRTLCVHGDTPGALAFVKAVREALLERGHELRAFS